MTHLIFGAIQLGLIYALMAMGNYISFRILNIPDLTVDGSFALGMAVSVMTAASGHPFLALLLAILAGAMAGIVTGLLQTKVGINPILAGILTMTSLYSVNLFIMGGVEYDWWTDSVDLNAGGANAEIKLSDMSISIGFGVEF